MIRYATLLGNGGLAAGRRGQHTHHCCPWQSFSKKILSPHSVLQFLKQFFKKVGLSPTVSYNFLKTIFQNHWFVSYSIL